MEPTNETTKRRREADSPDAGASILAGGLICLADRKNAAYGLYKLIKQESAPPPALPERTDADLARLIMQLERKP